MLAPLQACRGPVRAALERALEGREVSVEDAFVLARPEARSFARSAPSPIPSGRRRSATSSTYVVNRNVNFTNVCVKACRFCAFSRTQRSEEGYLLDLDEIVRRVVEARDLGATEVCIQAGLAPGMDPGFYASLCRAVKRATPAIAHPRVLARGDASTARGSRRSRSRRSWRS